MQSVHEQALKQNTAMNQQFGSSVQQWITNPLQMAGQAAGKFAAEYGMVGVGILGVGTAAAMAGKMVFDLTRQVGAAAIEFRNLASRTGMSVEGAQLVSQTSGVLGVNPNAMVTAMRTLSRGLGDVSGEGKKAKEALEQIGITGYQAFLPMDQLMPLIFDHLNQVGNAMEKDRLAIALFGRGGLELMPLIEQFRQMSLAVSATGVIINKEGINNLVEYEEHIRLLGLRWKGLINIFAQKAIGIVELNTMLFNPFKMNAGTAWNAVFGGNAAPPKPFQPQGTGTLTQDYVTAQGRSDAADFIQTYSASHGSLVDRNAVQLQNLENKRTSSQESYFADPTGAGKQQAFIDAAKKVEDFKASEAAAKTATEAEKKLAEARKKVAEWTERSIMAEDKAGAATPAQRLAGETAATQAERIARMKEFDPAMMAANPDLGAGINQAAANQQAANVKKYQAEVAKNALELAEALERATIAVDTSYRSTVDTSLRRTEKLDDDPVTRMLMATMPQLPAGMTTPQIIQRNQMTAGSALNIAKLGQTAGGKAALTQSTDDATAQQSYDLQIKYNNLVLSKQAAEVANEIALNVMIEKKYANELRYEEEMAALREAQMKAFESKSVELFHALLSGHGAQFGRSLGMGMADKVVGNAAGMAFSSLNLGGKVPQLPGFLGALTKGTPFSTGITNDPVVSSNVANTAATIANTNGLAQLNASVGGPSIPGTSATAPDSNSLLGLLGGIPGQGPSTSTIASNPFALVGGLMNGLGGGVASGTASNPWGSVASALGLAAGGGAAAGTAAANPFGVFGGLTNGLGGTVSPAAMTARLSTPAGSSSTTNFGTGFANPFNQIFGGSESTGSGSATTNAATGIAGDFGAGVAVAGAGFGVYQGVKSFMKGGAQGALSGVGDITGAAAMLDPEPISKAILMGVSMLTEFTAAIFGDPKVNRANAIANDLKFSQFLAPVAQNVTMDTSGHYADTNFLGQARSSNLSPYPVTQKPYFDLNNNVIVPGRTLNQFGPPVGPQSAPPPAPVTIMAMDSQSFQDWGVRNADAFEHVMTNVVQRAAGNFVSAARNQLG